MSLIDIYLTTNRKTRFVMKNFFGYKGYKGSVEFRADEKVFYGKIQGIKDLILFEGESVSELENNFKESVNDYLETCKEIGKEPNQTPWKSDLNQEHPWT